ncbi:MAG: 30S ribosomal protein S9, partial [Actinomycetes bacterium]
MADTTSQTAETEDVEFSTDERGVAYSSESAPSADAPLRPATIAPAAATGRRKQAIARVRIVPGSGQWSVNG